VSSQPDGILVVDKPAGMTSHDVVDEVRKRFDTRKVGHAGTLDPDATGILVLGLGKATRLLDITQAYPKRYRAEALFGVSTTTQDASGDVVERNPAGDVDADRIAAALEAFLGDIEQIPPMVSAVKIDGERLYEKARRGEEVDRPPRAVTVYAFDLLELTPGDRPTARFDVVCSSGTYVRTLVHDLGAALGSGAHLTSLRRTEACGFSESDAVPLADVGFGHLRPLLDAIRWLAAVQVDANGAELVGHGRPLELGRLRGVGGEQDGAEGESAGEELKGPEDGMLLAIVHEGNLLAVYRTEGDSLVPERVFV
jgi:tRNA pseudouridine55 synthase